MFSGEFKFRVSTVVEFDPRKRRRDVTKRTFFINLSMIMRISVAVCAFFARDLFVKAGEMTFFTIENLVFSGELKFCLVVPDDIKRGIQKVPIDTVASLAILIFELSLVSESVAIGTLLKMSDFELGGWLVMAGFTFNSLVVAL
jgi:hypothetical protein